LVEALCRTYRVAGESVSFVFDDERTAERVTRLISGWHFVACPDDPSSAFTIELSRSAAPSIPNGAAFAIHHGEGFFHGDSLYLTTSDSAMRVRSHRVEVWIGAETERSPTAFARVMFYATQAALRRCGLFELHTAAVMNRDSEDGVLIIGPSGSGKTTLAMRLTAAGWSNVADDLVLIREDSRAAEAFAFRKVFAATETTLVVFPPARIEEATREPNAFEPSKRRLDPEVLFPGRFASSCTPRALVFPVITGEAQSETQAIAATDALTRLLKMCPWASYDTAVARPHLNALARLARQCASYTLSAGTDLLYDAEAAPQLFSALPMGAR
jgi:hypothetical protein